MSKEIGRFFFQIVLAFSEYTNLKKELDLRDEPCEQRKLETIEEMNRRYKRSLPIMGMPTPTPTACTVDPNPHPCIAELFSMLPTPVSQYYRILLATHCRLWTYT